MLAIALVLAAKATCPVEIAHYSLRHMDAVTLTFKPIATSKDWPSGLALAVHNATTGHTNYFLPWNGGTDGRQNVAHTTDVTVPDFKLPSPDGGPGRLGDMVYIATDEGYNVLTEMPENAGKAPAHILLSDLSDSSWNPDSTVKQFFDLDTCDGVER